MSVKYCTTHFHACDCREAMFAEMLEELKASLGHLLNAKIDLETGATKATAIRTIDGGLNRARAAIAKATGERAYEERVG